MTINKDTFQRLTLIIISSISNSDGDREESSNTPNLASTELSTYKYLPTYLRAKVDM